MAQATIKKYIGISIAVGIPPEDVASMLKQAVEKLAGSSSGRLVIADMPCCGRSFPSATIEDIPTETTPCPCGTEGMCVVKYEEA